MGCCRGKSNLNTIHLIYELRHSTFSVPSSTQPICLWFMQERTSKRCFNKNACHHFCSSLAFFSNHTKLFADLFSHQIFIDCKYFYDKSFVLSLLACLGFPRLEIVSLKCLIFPATIHFSKQRQRPYYFLFSVKRLSWLSTSRNKKAKQ